MVAIVDWFAGLSPSSVPRIWMTTGPKKSAAGRNSSEPALRTAVPCEFVGPRTMASLAKTTVCEDSSAGPSEKMLSGVITSGWVSSSAMANVVPITLGASLTAATVNVTTPVASTGFG